MTVFGAGRVGGVVADAAGSGRGAPTAGRDGECLALGAGGRPALAGAAPTDRAGPALEPLELGFTPLAAFIVLSSSITAPRSDMLACSNTDHAFSDHGVVAGVRQCNAM